MSPLPPHRPDLFGPVHPAHPPVDATGILAWLVGSKESGRWSKSVRRAVPTPTPKPYLPNKQVPVLAEKINNLAAFSKPLRGIFWVAATMAALGLIGGLVWQLTTPPRPLPQATTSTAPVSRTTKPDTAPVPTSAPSVGGAPVEVADAPAVRTPALIPSGHEVATAVAPKATGRAPARADKKVHSTPAVDPNPTAEPVEPPDLDTQVIESILPHLPPVPRPENQD